jgi:hypothetical protein
LAIDTIFIDRPQFTNSRQHIYADVTPNSLAACHDSHLISASQWSITVPIHWAELLATFSTFSYIYGLANECPDSSIHLYTDNVLVQKVASSSA